MTNITSLQTARQNRAEAEARQRAERLAAAAKMMAAGARLAGRDAKALALAMAKRV